MHTGHNVQVRPAMGSWILYGLGAETRDLPGFVVLVCGDIMTMPGLPKVPSACAIDVGPDGKISGLF